MAEAVFLDNVAKLDDASRSQIGHIDSCGTGAYHARAPPDPRTTQVLKKHGISSYQHSARKIKTSDFEDFDYLLGMDAENLEDLQEMRDRLVKRRQSETGIGKVMLFGHFGGKKKDEEVVDPYYGYDNGFDLAFEQMQRFSKGFLEHLQKESSGKA